MSRSHRRPFMSVCGKGSAKKDKRIAARAYRRLINYWIRNSSLSEDDYLVPQRRDAAHNNPWGWNRDGKQRWQSLEDYTRSARVDLGVSLNSKLDIIGLGAEYCVREMQDDIERYKEVLRK